MKTINIKGKEYVTVNERLKFFRENFTGYSLETELVQLDEERVTMRAVIKNENGNIVATGFAQEIKSNPLSMVNKTSYVENCETSAWGRALGNLGIGIDSSVATAEEVVNAVAKKFIPAEKPKPTKTQQVIEALKGTTLKNEDVATWINQKLGKQVKVEELETATFKELLNYIEKKQIIEEREI